MGLSGRVGKSHIEKEMERIRLAFVGVRRRRLLNAGYIDACWGGAVRRVASSLAKELIVELVVSAPGFAGPLHDRLIPLARIGTHVRRVFGENGFVDQLKISTGGFLLPELGIACIARLEHKRIGFMVGTCAETIAAVLKLQLPISIVERGDIPYLAAYATSDLGGLVTQHAKTVFAIAQDEIVKSSWRRRWCKCCRW